MNAHTAISVQTSVAVAQKVVPTVNQTKLFASMNHMFASSLSVLSELMQNARRSGASFVGFDFDQESKTLTITDDGCGIADFSKLFELCESGWDEQTTLNDKPFGMGFFSVLFACQAVTIRSMGLVLQASLDDVVNRRTLSAVPDLSPIVQGTVIELNQLSETLIKAIPLSTNNGTYRLKEELLPLAMGFAIDVRFNGESLPRPHAMDNLVTTLTPQGHVHMPCISTEEETATDRSSLIGDCSSIRTNNTNLYLQGLPIGLPNCRYATTIIHLDGQRFTPQMPDRKHLHNGAQAIEELNETLLKMVQSFLVAQKAKLAGTSFVKKYWQSCIAAKRADLLNDIPYIPSSILSAIQTVCRNPDDRCGRGELEWPVLHQDQILCGEVKIWRDVPCSTVEDGYENVGVLWKAMQIEKIYEAQTTWLDRGHWIFGATPSATDLRIEVTATESIGQESIDIEGIDVEVKLVEAVDIRITSSVDPGFELALHVVDNWIMVDDVIDEHENVERMICYVMKDDRSFDHAADFLSNFVDEYDIYRDDACEAARKEWDALVENLRGSSLAFQLEENLHDLPISLGEHNVGQMALLCATKAHSWIKPSIVELEDMQLWKRLSEMMSATESLTAETVKAAFLASALESIENA